MHLIAKSAYFKRHRSLADYLSPVDPGSRITCSRARIGILYFGGPAGQRLTRPIEKGAKRACHGKGEAVAGDHTSGTDSEQVAADGTPKRSPTCTDLRYFAVLLDLSAPSLVGDKQQTEISI